MRRSVAIWLVAPILLFAATAAAERLPIQTYSSINGLPQDAVFDIGRDSRGFLWFCTPAGISRFDGRNLRSYAIPVGSARAFLETRSGRRWVATTSGLLLFDPEGEETAGSARPMFRPIGNAGSPLTFSLTRLYEDRQGVLWGASPRGLVRIDQHNGEWRGTLIDVRPEELRRDTLAVTSNVQEDHHGVLWVSWYAGIARFWPDGVSEAVTCGGRIGGYPKVLVRRNGQVLISGDGSLWEINPGPTRDSPLHCAEHPIGHSKLISNSFVALYETKDGVVWGSKRRTLWQMTRSPGVPRWTFQEYGEPQGIPGSPILNFTEDLAGDLWLSMRTGGAACLRRRGLRTYGLSDGLTSATVFRFQLDRSGVLHAVGIDDSSRVAISRLDGTRFTSVTPWVPKTIGRSMGGVAAMLDRSGSWWIHWAGLLLRYPPVTRIEELAQARPRIYSKADGVPDWSVRCLMEDAQGRIWVSAYIDSKRWQVARLEDGRFLPVAREEWGGSAPHDMALDPSGQLWAAVPNGVWKLHSGRWQLVLPVGNGGVAHIAFDSRHRLWGATRRNGLLRIDNPGSPQPQSRFYNVANGLVTDTLFSVAEGRAGAIFVSSPSGVARLDPDTGRISALTMADGLPDQDVYMVARDRDGAIWMGTGRGVAHLVAQADAAPPTTGRIWIHEVRVSGTPRRSAAVGTAALDLGSLSASENSLTFSFAMPWFRNSLPVRYQFRLDGADRDFSPPNTDTSVHFSNLAPGTYRFRVKALPPDGAPNRSEATVTFRVLAPWWKRWWVILSAALLLSAAAYTAHRYQLQRALAIERMRSQIAADLHDDIGATLTQMAILGETVRHEALAGRPEVDSHLEKLTALSREAIDSIADVVWAVNPRRDNFNDMAQKMRRFASDTLSARQIILFFDEDMGDSERRMDAILRRELYLILKESVNNAARHSAATEVRIALKAQGRRIRLVVADNGRGFDPNVTHDGNGLSSLRVRAARVDASLTIESSPGAGSVVTVDAPVGRDRHYSWR